MPRPPSRRFREWMDFDRTANTLLPTRLWFVTTHFNETGEGEPPLLARVEAYRSQAHAIAMVRELRGYYRHSGNRMTFAVTPQAEIPPAMVEEARVDIVMREFGAGDWEGATYKQRWPPGFTTAMQELWKERLTRERDARARRRAATLPRMNGRP